VEAVLSQRWLRNAPYTWAPWKISGFPDYAHGYYSQNFSRAFVPIQPMNVPTKFEVRSFIRSWDNRGYPKKFGQPLDTPTLPFFQNFLWDVILIDPVNVFAKFEFRSFTRSRDNRGYPKIWTAPGYAHAPFSPKFLTGFYSEWPCKYIPQIWSP